MVTTSAVRPSELKPEDSLAPIARRMSELLGFEVKLVATGSMA
jgi:phosphoglycerate kinase